ncbi:hypothetical protein ACHAXR_009542 [Thalassiosira sp. AJA248-18]
MKMVADDHTKTHSWQGWADAATNHRQFGLELQSPFAAHVLNGRKTIETRAYALPPDLLSRNNENGEGVKIDILESEKGQDGVSSIPNRVSLTNNNDDLLTRKGWCTFSRSFRYTSRAQFEADVDKHMVDPSSSYGWSDERPMYGWVVGSRGVITDDNEYDIAERRMRSLFELRCQKNSMPTILITGASGMLGRALHRHLLESSSLSPSSNYNVIGTGHTRLQVDHYPKYFSPSANNENASKPEKVQLHQLDLLDFHATTEFLQKHRPDIIVHCAAERFPDAFETKLEESMKLNVEGTKHLAKECQRLATIVENDKHDNAMNSRSGPYFIYLSTSYVFDGGVSSKEYPPYQPQSKANPVNNYGRSKWEGECAVRDILNSSSSTNESEGMAAGDRGIIVRVPLLYGEDCCDLNESPALEMMKVFLPNEAVPTTRKKIDHWALRFPTSVEDVSRVLKLMIDKVLEEKNFPVGTYHIASPHGTTKYELMQLQTKSMGIPASQVEERTEGNSGGPPKKSAPRPQCTQLDCSETWKALDLNDEQFEFVSLEDGMKRALIGYPERFMK